MNIVIVWVYWSGKIYLFVKVSLSPTKIVREFLKQKMDQVDGEKDELDTTVGFLYKTMRKNVLMN